MDGGVTCFIVAILIVAILTFVMIIITGKNRSKLNTEIYQAKLLELENKLSATNSATFMNTVMNADKLLDKAMIELGIHGKTMGERLKKSGNRFSNINDVWRAHKLRNSLAHEDGLEISYEQASAALSTYKQALKDLGSYLMKYIPTIGIECHVQLATKTKLFSEVDNDARHKEPNSCVSPVDYALPGMLPRLNKAAVQLAIRAGKAMNAVINPHSRFDRKHYFYPDSPKGYQITQFFSPIIGEGYVELPSGKTIRIEHAHLEGDAGKLTHYADYSLVDLNRVDTPLIEIVSMPDIHSAKDAHDYCKELWRLMIYSGASYGDLYNGNMRFDVNVSIAPEESSELGTRAEIKNLNSFRSVERAVEYEITRQSKLLDAGEKVIQETRGWNDNTGKTTSQRSKEEAKDYRYMPEPDIPPLNLSQEFIDTEIGKLPLMPNDYRKKFSDVLPNDLLEVLLDYPPLMHKLAEVQEVKMVANWFASVLLAEEKSAEYLNDLPVTKQLNDLATMNLAKELSSTATKEVFLRLFDPEMKVKETRAIAKELGLIQENDLSALEGIIDTVLAKPETQKAQTDFRNGEEKVIGFLVGQVMKESKGKANPSLVQEILRKKLA